MIKITYALPCLTLTFIAALTGCGGPEFTKPDVGEQQYNADLSACLAEAQANNPTAGRADIAILFRKRAECMVRKGYVEG